MKKAKALSPLSPDYALVVKEPYLEPQPIDIPSLNILIQIVGSRGDVQPYLSLAIELVLCPSRHRVRLATHDEFKDFVLDTGKRILRTRLRQRQTGYMVDEKDFEDRLEFFPIGGSPKELMAYMVKSGCCTPHCGRSIPLTFSFPVAEDPGLIPGLESIRKGEIGAKKRMLKEMMHNFFLSTFYPDPVSGQHFAPDALLCNPPSFAHIHLAESFGLPLMISFSESMRYARNLLLMRNCRHLPAMPWSPTVAFTHPLVNVQQSDADESLTNYFTYSLAEIMTWQGLSGLINKFRQKQLKLKTLANREGQGIADRLEIPHMYCWSPAMIPKPRDWSTHIDVVGYFFLEDQDYEPEPALRNFLAEGPPPVYIG